MALPLLPARGAPWLVGVVGDPNAVADCAKHAPEARGVDVLEVRVDLFDVPDVGGWALAGERLEASGTPVLVTIRLESEGGRWTAPDAERLDFYRQAVGFASWVDVEAASPLAAEVTAMAHARRRRAIVSHHDFARTPPLGELARLVDACRAAGADIAKVATTVGADADREALFGLLRQRPDGTSVIGMSPAGDDLRVELCARGSCLAYGYVDRPTAPGQLSAAEMDQRLRAALPDYAARRGVKA